RRRRLLESPPGRGNARLNASAGPLRRPTPTGAVADPCLSELAHLAAPTSDCDAAVARGRSPGLAVALSRTGRRPLARSLLSCRPPVAWRADRQRAANPRPSPPLSHEPARGRRAALCPRRHDLTPDVPAPRPLSRSHRPPAHRPRLVRRRSLRIR